MIKKANYFSWIPNITGSLNFKYISDNIVQEDREHRLYQVVYSADEKYFLLDDIDFSDQIDDSEKGIRKKIVCRLKNEGKNLTGQYYEFSETILDDSKKQKLSELIRNFKVDNTHKKTLQTNFNSIEKEIKRIFSAKFNIAPNGLIRMNIEYDSKDVDLQDSDIESLKVPLMTYKAIKYILHKDIFHSEEDDYIIGVYNSPDKLQEIILTSMLKYIKSYERILKDDIKDGDEINFIKKDFYERLVVKVEGIKTYMSSFNIIFKASNAEKSTENLDYKIDLAENAILSMKHMIDDLTKSFSYREFYKDIKIYIIALFVSLSILVTGHFSPVLEMRGSSYWVYPITFIFALLLSFFVFIDYMYKLSFNKYIDYSAKASEKFLKRRLDREYVRGLNIKFGLAIIAIIFAFFVLLKGYSFSDVINITKTSFSSTANLFLSYLP